MTTTPENVPRIRAQNRSDIIGNTEQRPWERPKERVRATVQGVAGEGSLAQEFRLPLLTTRAPWDPQLSWTWQTSCHGKALFSFGARYAAQAVTVDDAKCKESVQNWDGRLLVRILRLWHLMLRHVGLMVLFFEEIREHDWWVLVHWTAVCFSRVCICAELWRGEAVVMLEERASNVARCGQRKDVCSLCIGADDVGPCCCVVTHRADVLQRVVGPAHDEITHASNAAGDAGNVVGLVLDFPTNVTCRVPAQCGLEGSLFWLCPAAGTRPWCWAARRRAGCGHASPDGGPGILG